MRLQFIGSGGAFGSGGRFNTCFHVDAVDANFLIDCGATSPVTAVGIYALRDQFSATPVAAKGAGTVIVIPQSTSPRSKFSTSKVRGRGRRAPMLSSCGKHQNACVALQFLAALAVNGGLISCGLSAKTIATTDSKSLSANFAIGGILFR